MSAVIFELLEETTVVSFNFNRDDGTEVQGIMRVSNRTGIYYLSKPKLTQEEKDMLKRRFYGKN